MQSGENYCYGGIIDRLLEKWGKWRIFERVCEWHESRLSNEGGWWIGREYLLNIGNEE